jgi:hypothetical protein
MVLELDTQERQIVKYALEVLEEELRTERAKTDKMELKAAIHDEEYAVRRILKKVA